MAKNTMKLDLNGFKELLERIQKAGGNIDTAAEKALVESAKPFMEDPAARANILAKIKLGRLGQVEDVMGAIVYLASDASALVTGTSLLVDGGWTAD